MFQLTDEQTIFLSRGDSISFTLLIGVGNKLCFYYHRLQEGEKVYLGIMEPNQSFEHSIVKKAFTMEDMDKDGLITISLQPKDTEFLKEQEYRYSIKFVNSNETKVETIVDKKMLFIV